MLWLVVVTTAVVVQGVHVDNTPKWFELADKYFQLTPDESPVRIPEGDYYITNSAASKYHGFHLSFYKDDDLHWRDDQRPIWRLYYPRFAEPHFVLQNMWRGHEGTGHPWYGWFAQLDSRHIELEPWDPTLWVAFAASDNTTYHLRSLTDRDKWLGRGSGGRLVLRHLLHEKDALRFTRLD